MSTLCLRSWKMPAAGLGPENPLPPLFKEKILQVAQSVDPAVPDDIRKNMNYGHPPNILPYGIQDGYTRKRRERDFRVAVLENEVLRASFLLEMGGRLWSLHHKPSDRELLFVNPVFQPANLALRNAWFSGGVEWNIGTIGHTAFTCSPVFAARVEGPGGTPVLRMYEWERMRGVTYRIDAWLPDGSPVLLVRIVVRNPQDQDVPMYWWSNIAVPETSGTRVVVPAETAYRYTYDRLDKIPVPGNDEADFTYPVRVKRATDFFFHVPEGRLPWIAAIDEKGCGLIQVSTRRLKGRKAFVWGMGAGGRNWQEFLSAPGHAYLEIQAGLARTQLEHLPMPAGSEWGWLEAYGLIETDARAVHGPDWAKATLEVSRCLEELLPRESLERELASVEAFADVSPIEILQRGSGWGALERMRREAAGEPPMCSKGLIFDNLSITEEQQPWIVLLEKKKFPQRPPDPPPRGFMVQEEWQARLENIPVPERNWLAWLHLGVMRFHCKDYSGAGRAWESSFRSAETPWALRNLAVLDRMANRFDAAAEKYIAACRMKPESAPLAVEAGRFLVGAGYAGRWLSLLTCFPPEIRGKGRVALLECRAVLATGDLDRAGEILSDLPVVEDIREGETSLSELWFEYHARVLGRAEDRFDGDDGLSNLRQRFPLPPHLDFGMSED